MAALRYAARRLGGRALQRPQGVAAAEEPSLIHARSRSTSSAATSANTKVVPTRPVILLRNLRSLIYQYSNSFRNNNKVHGPTVNEKGPLTQIQEKKEELFRIIVENDSRAVGKLRRQNRELLRHLSAHVYPKPYDRTWYTLEHMHTALIISAHMIALSLVDLVEWKNGTDPKGKGVAFERKKQ